MTDVVHIVAEEEVYVGSPQSPGPSCLDSMLYGLIMRQDDGNPLVLYAFIETHQPGQSTRFL